MIDHGCKGLAYREIKGSNHLIYNKEESREHTDGLKGIGPDQCLDASPAGVKPYQTDHTYHRNGKGNAIRLEDKTLQDDAHHIKTHGSTRHFRKQEEPASRLVGTLPQTPFQITVDGGQIQAVIDRQQQECH